MDQGIEYLLELNGHIISQEKGCWAKFESSIAEITQEKPHGVSYSITLHDEDGKRILGFDNAHGVNKFLPRFHKKIVAWDHEHKLGNNTKIFPYEFESAEKLLSDFWEEVDIALNVLKEQR